MPLDKKVYEAITPSVSGFVDRKTMKPLGKVLVATSPNGKRGMSWRRYQNSFKSKSVMMIHLPSHWVNPYVSPQFLREMYEESEASFEQEYLAKFTNQISGFIKTETDLLVVEDLNITNSLNASRKFRYYMTIDPALSMDSFAISVCHYEKNYERQLSDENLYKLIPEDIEGTYIVDYVDSLVPEDSDTPIDIDYAMEKVASVYKAFNPMVVGFDQWSKEFIKKALRKIGIPEKKFVELNADVKNNSIWATTFKRQIKKRSIVWSPNAVDGWGVPFTDEVRSLEEKINGQFIKVEAKDGSHDDRFNSVCKSVYLCEIDPKKDVVENFDYPKKVATRHNKRMLTAINKRGRR